MFRQDKKQEPAGGLDPEAKEGQDGNGTGTINNTNDAVQEYPTGLRLALVLSSIYISIFLVSLDRLIVTTAIPAITNEFDSLPDVGWYGAAYLLATCAFQLLFGKIYSFYPIRAVYAISILLFEVGSAICGAAPNSIALILGRVVQGVGSAGIFSGGLVVIVFALPLHRRPFFQGMIGAVFGVSSILGPLVGGAFTSRVTWRWCFFINLPFGAVALAIVVFLLHVPDREETKLPTKAKLSQLDAAGSIAIIPATVAILLALQWGGLTYTWNDRRVIALLTLGIFLGIVFILVQVFMPKTATIPPRIFKQRSVVAGCLSTLVLGSQMTIFVYYLPVWFQAIQGVAAVDSGIRLLPTTLSVVVASISNGIFVTKIGYYTPSMLVGTVISTTGAGLLTTLQVDTGMAKWIGYQVLYGFGLGLSFQAPNLAAQTVLPKNDVSIGVSLMFFNQLLGGAIFVSVGQNVLNNQLVQRLAGLPGFSPQLIESGGATSLIQSFPAEYRPAVIHAYNESLRTVFRVGLVLCATAFIGAALMEWRSVKKQPSTVEGDKLSSPADAEMGGGTTTTTTTTLDSKSDIEKSAAGATVGPTPPLTVDEKSDSHHHHHLGDTTEKADR